MSHGVKLHTDSARTRGKRQRLTQAAVARCVASKVRRVSRVQNATCRITLCESLELYRPPSCCRRRRHGPQLVPHYLLPQVCSKHSSCWQQPIEAEALAAAKNFVHVGSGGVLFALW